MAFTAGSRILASALNSETFQLIQTVPITTTTASVTVTIPTGFNRIKVFWRGRMSDAVVAEELLLRLNGDSANHYLWEVNQSNNTGAVSGGASGAAVALIQVGTITGNSATALYYGSGEFTIDGVSDTTNYKTVSGVGYGGVTTTNQYVGVYGGLYISASAVTSFTLYGNSGSWLTGGSISVYGVQ